MITGSVICGRPVSGVIVCTPAPGMLKAMVSTPPVGLVAALASTITWRSDPGPLSSVLITVNVASSSRASIGSTRGREEVRARRHRLSGKRGMRPSPEVEDTARGSSATTAAVSQGLIAAGADAETGGPADSLPAGPARTPRHSDSWPGHPVSRVPATKEGPNERRRRRPVSATARGQAFRAGRLRRAHAAIRTKATPASRADDGSGTDVAMNACKPPSAVS